MPQINTVELTAAIRAVDAATGEVRRAAAVDFSALVADALDEVAGALTDILDILDSLDVE